MVSVYHSESNKQDIGDLQLQTMVNTHFLYILLTRMQDGFSVSSGLQLRGEETDSDSLK